VPRKKGSPNADFAAKKQDLLRLIRSALHGENPPSSLRSLAKAANVTLPTLRHYFGDREQVFAAVFADCRAGGRRELETAAVATGAFAKSISDLVRHIADGFRYGGLDRLHAVGLIEGLGNARVAGAYLAEVLEPTLSATQARLETHIGRGEMRATDARHAALRLVSPILVLFLHQQALGGAADYPMDTEAFLAGHVDAFVATHQR
jgi:AcrR family transcriptional regulator